MEKKLPQVTVLASWNIISEEIAGFTIFKTWLQ